MNSNETNAKTFIFVTTFSDRGFARYGRVMLSSFQCLMKEKLYLVRGSDFTHDIKLDGIIVIENEFDAEVKSFVHNSSDMQGNKFEYSPHRFIHKPTAILSVYNLLKERECNVDYMVWLDGDSIILNDNLSLKLKQIAPQENQVASYFDRTHAFHYCEAGIIIFNLKSLELPKFLRRWTDIFIKNEIFHYREWHDAFIFSWLVDSYPPGVFRMLCQEFKLKTAHPIAEFSLISSSIDHLKGDERKTIGVSLERKKIYGNFTSKLLIFFMRLFATLRN